MRKLAEAGMADLAAPPPELTPHARLATHCWSWCDGWAPERWPVYAAFHDVDDWPRLIELMQALRAEVRKQEGGAS